MPFFKGTTGNDNLVGTDLADLIFGDAGNDTIDGGAGNDKLAGEDGNDTFKGGAGADQMSGGAGVDTVDYSGSVTGVTVDLRTGTGSRGDAEGDTLSGIENLIGSNGPWGDTLTGDSNDNILDGRRGSDFLFGNDGKDTLIGGMGNDTMAGGAGPDTFVFNPFFYPDGRIQGDNNDVITDFKVGTDVIEFTGAVVNSLADLSFSKVGNDTVIEYGGYNSITLVGVSFEQLMANQAHDFLFV
jgi:Ca2+-binding RTX toxin-like protein